MKFEDAYCDFEHRNISISEATLLYKNDSSLFELQYRRSFQCPECRAVRLSYNHAATPFFSTYPNCPHGKDCSLQQEEMGKREVDHYIDQVADKKKIERDEERLMHILLAEDAKKGIEKVPPEKGNGGDDPEPPMEKKKYRARKRPPRKRIDQALREEDFNCYKYFYGDVNCRWEEDTTPRKGYNMILYEQDENLCRIHVTELVYRHLSVSYEDRETFRCKIVFLASLEKGNMGVAFTSLRRSEYLLFHRV